MLDRPSRFRNLLGFFIGLSFLVVPGQQLQAQFIFPQATNMTPLSIPANNPAFTLTIHGVGFQSNGNAYPQGGALIATIKVSSPDSLPSPIGYFGPLKGTLFVTGDSGVFTIDVPKDFFSHASGNFIFTADWCSDSCDSPVAFPFTVTPSSQCQSGLQPDSGASLFDPVPTLLSPDAPSITTDITDLLDPSKGRPVVGVAADGVAQLVVRIPACKLGENVSVTIIDEFEQPSNSVDTNGGISVPGTDLASYASTTNTTTVGTDDQPLAIITYRAPIDFVRDESTADKDAKERHVTLQISFSSLPNQTISKEIKIIRPPVVLIHGIWGDETTWSAFTSLTADPLGRFRVSFANYDQPVNATSTSPKYKDSIVVRANSLGLQFNQHNILNSIEKTVQEITNAKNDPYAVVQADLVAHSMGGLIARFLYKDSHFFARTNYGKGLIHKLITIDTPHLGTPLAIGLLDGNNNCIRDVLADHGSPSFHNVVVNGQRVTGAVEDLEGNGRGQFLSDALTSLQVLELLAVGPPTALITGSMDESNLHSLDSSVNAAILRNIKCPLDNLVRNLTSSDWPLLLGTGSDAIVPLASQRNNRTNRDLNVPGVIHADATGDLGFGLPSVLGSPATSSAVIDRLNQSVKTDSIFLIFSR